MKDSSKGRLRTYKGPLSAKVTLLASVNPKIGKSRERFALYKQGMTVAEYYWRCECARHEAKRYKSDIEWDLERRFIKLD